MDNSAAYALKIIKMMANSEFDAEAYEKSNTFRTICRYQECMAENPDEGSDAAFQYWWKRGLIAIIPENESRKGYKRRTSDPGEFINVYKGTCEISQVPFLLKNRIPETHCGKRRVFRHMGRIIQHHDLFRIRAERFPFRNVLSIGITVLHKVQQIF